MRRSSRNTKLPREWVGWLGATFSARGSRIAVALVGAMDGDRLDRRGAQSLPLARPGTGRSRSAACCLIVSTPPGAGGGRPAPHGRRTTVLPLRRANAAPPRFPNRSVESRPTRQPARGSTGLPQRPEGKVSTTLLASLISFVRSGRLGCRSGDACLAVQRPLHKPLRAAFRCVQITSRRFPATSNQSRTGLNGREMALHEVTQMVGCDSIQWPRVCATASAPSSTEMAAITGSCGFPE